MEACIAKGIGNGHEEKYNKRWLHLGFGCSPEGRDHVCPPRDPPPGGWIDKLWGTGMAKREEAKAKAAQAQKA
eukprot:8410752-Karenia_brevis.AAC.1